jgi:hypothetical protein
MIRRLLIAVTGTASAGALLVAVLLLARFGARAWLVAFMACMVGVALLTLLVRMLRRPSTRTAAGDEVRPDS